MKRRIGSIVIGVLLVAAVPGCSRDGRSPAAAGADGVALTVFGGYGDPSDTEGAIATAQERLRAVPGDDSARVALARAYLQRAREVADPTYYAKAQTVLRELLRSHPDDIQVLLASGTLALAQHRFRDALALARRAERAAPGSEAALGLLVDASNELGRYDEALEATQRMVDTKPNLASLARVSYARELRGDVAGAIEAMTQAARAGGTTGENVAYVRTQLAILLVNDGQLDAAARELEAAEAAFPKFAPAMVARGRLLIARGEPGPAAAVLADAVRTQPTAEAVILHGDALAAAGRAEEAEEAYALVEVIAQLYRANGVDSDLEMALFHADHAPGRASVQEARAALTDRPSYLGHEVLAWALFRAGDPEAAWESMGEALSQGSRDPQLRYHAAVIALARDDLEGARENLQVVLDQNPNFSAAHAAHVAELTGRLGLQAR